MGYPAKSGNSTDAQLRDRATHTGEQAISTITELITALNDKVTVVAGKGLSTNDYDNTQKQKLTDIAAGAEVNLTTKEMQDLIAAMFQAGTHTNATVNYDGVNGVINISAAGDGSGGGLTQEEVEDIVGGVATQGTGINVNYDDANDALVIALTGETFTTTHKNIVESTPADIATLQQRIDALEPNVAGANVYIRETEPNTPDPYVWYKVDSNGDLLDVLFSTQTESAANYNDQLPISEPVVSSNDIADYARKSQSNLFTSYNEVPVTPTVGGSTFIPDLQKPVQRFETDQNFSISAPINGPANNIYRSGLIYIVYAGAHSCTSINAAFAQADGDTFSPSNTSGKFDIIAWHHTGTELTFTMRTGFTSPS